MINFSPILDGIVIGSTPYSQLDVQQLSTNLNIGSVLSLQTRVDHKKYKIDINDLSGHYQTNDMVYYNVPIVEFDARDLTDNLTAAVDCIEESLDDGRAIYVHCNQGIERAPTCVAAWLIKHYDMSEQQATAWLRERRPVSRPVLPALSARFFDLTQQKTGTL